MIKEFAYFTVKLETDCKHEYICIYVMLKMIFTYCQNFLCHKISCLFKQQCIIETLYTLLDIFICLFVCLFLCFFPRDNLLSIVFKPGITIH